MNEADLQEFLWIPFISADFKRWCRVSLPSHIHTIMTNTYTFFIAFFTLKITSAVRTGILWTDSAWLINFLMISPSVVPVVSNVHRIPISLQVNERMSNPYLIWLWKFATFPWIFLCTFFNSREKISSVINPAGVAGVHVMIPTFGIFCFNIHEIARIRSLNLLIIHMPKNFSYHRFLIIPYLKTWNFSRFCDTGVDIACSPYHSLT